MQESRENTITYELDVDNPPPLTPQQQTELDSLAKMPDSEIDFSDIPPIEDFSGFFRPGSGTATLRLDQDVLDWLRSMKGEFQTRVNAILRREMLASRAHLRTGA